MKSVHRKATQSIKSTLIDRWKLPKGFWFLSIPFWLALTPQAIMANDTTINFTATIDRIVGLEGATLSSTVNEVKGEMTFTDSNHLEPGFYDGHTWQNAVKQISFGAPINAAFAGMGVALYPDQHFISVFYSPDKCPQIGIVCSASGTSKFTLPDGTQPDLTALSYHIHLPLNENPQPKLEDVIERFIVDTGNGTTKVLVRYSHEDSDESILTLVMTINALERSN